MMEKPWSAAGRGAVRKHSLSCGRPANGLPDRSLMTPPAMLTRYPVPAGRSVAGLIVTLLPEMVTCVASVTGMVRKGVPLAPRMMMLPRPAWTASLKVRTMLAPGATVWAPFAGELATSTGRLVSFARDCGGWFPGQSDDGPERGVPCRPGDSGGKAPPACGVPKASMKFGPASKETN
ncbi:protein of unknown function [Rhodovastum atsumiense]|nr:protein of unknown function [Rhodovastum atsumiense]